MATLKIEKGDQVLYYFGSNHSYNPQNEQFEKLKKLWSEFLKRTRNQKRAVIIESNPTDPDPALTDETEIIFKYGERGLVKRWAKNNIIRVLFLQPKLKEEFDYLIKHFPPSESAYYFFARNFRQNVNKYGTDKFLESINGSIKTCVQQLPARKDLFALENLSVVHEKVFGLPIDASQAENLYRASVPVFSGTSIHKIAKISSDWRDKRELSIIKQEWNKGVSLFVLSGIHHLQQQKSQLHQILRDPL